MHTRESSTWESFWKENPIGFNFTMSQATLYFSQQLEKVLPSKPGDRFLDIGCGPGFFINAIKDKCEFAHGTDISEKYIQLCKKQYAQYPNISFSVTKAYDYEKYHQLIIDNRISKLLMLSILQYYKSEADVKELILSLNNTAKHQKFIGVLADIIPTKHSTLGDILSIAKHAVKNGYTLKFFRFLIFAVFSDYRKTKKNGMLQIDRSFFNNIAKELDLKIEIVNNLTLHSGRYNVLIYF
jgi:SAM-dependent methyltransferase